MLAPKAGGVLSCLRPFKRVNNLKTMFLNGLGVRLTSTDGTNYSEVAADIAKAYERISAHIHRTPVFTSEQADQTTGRKLYFKGEHLQKSGSFKVRGALNAVTHSSGNHGQAIAWASSTAGLRCSVVVPKTTPVVKKNAIKGYGATLVECGPVPKDRYDTCEQLQKEEGLHFISPYDHLDVIAGQGTIALELLEQVPDLDAIFVSVSGGGMSSGIALLAKSKKPDIKVFLVTPKGKKLEECLRTGKRPWTDPPKYLDTIADGIRLEQTGHITTPILMDLAEKDVFDMSDKEMIDGMKFCFERMKLVIEAAAGAAVAAAFSERFRNMDSSIRKVGIILCGGNLDIDNLPWYST